MPLNKPILDNRSYEQIRDELIQRIPVYAPEWTDHNPSDPGITLIELFSFLSENLLYRFNQIPEATQLEFLRLLQIHLGEAKPARALLTLSGKDQLTEVPIGTVAKAGKVKFETLDEVRVLPLSVSAIAKAIEEPPDATGDAEDKVFFQQALRAAGLRSEEEAQPYRTEVLDHETGLPLDFDQAVDGLLWVAVLAEKKGQSDTTRSRLAQAERPPVLLNLGFVPEIRVDKDQDITSPAFARRFRCPGEGHPQSGSAVEWQISTGRLDSDGQPVYRSLPIEGDTTEGLNVEGVVRLRLPNDIEDMKPFEITDPDRLGTGDFPPPLDDDLEARLVFWLRAFRHDGSRFGKVSYVGVNCIHVRQTVKARSEFLGTGTGQPNQTCSLIHSQVVPHSLVLEVEEADGWQRWQEVDGFQASGESDRHYLPDAEAGTVTFGNGLQGYAPQIGQRIRAVSYRYGGGSSGNVAPRAISRLEGVANVKCENPLKAYGGEDAEPVEKALDRIPGEIRRCDRAVTSSDFEELALMTPGGRIGRADTLPRFHPGTPDIEAAGVVSVVVWPQEDAQNPNAPMPDQHQLRSVCRWLDARRLVTTELYVLPPSYRPIAVAVGVEVKPGYGIDAVRHWVELLIRQFLAPLPPYGPEGDGWPLGKLVQAPELAAAALQVEGVKFLHDLQLVGWDEAGGRIDQKVVLKRYEVPELIGISVEEGPVTLDPGEAIRPQLPKKPPVPVPVAKEVC